MSDERIHPFELLVGYVLLCGVVLTLIFLSTGIVWRWVNTGHPSFEYSLVAENLWSFLRQSILEVRWGLLRPRLFINLGIGMLMLTPYARVLASLFYFVIVERNSKYIVVTGFVFAALTYSLFLR